MTSPSKIHHVAFLVHLENFDTTVASIASLLDLEFQGPYDLKDLGTRVVIDLDAGIEIMTVTNPGIATRQAQWLEEHGDGFYRLIVGVPDLAATIRRANEAGIKTLYEYDGLTVDPTWAERFLRYDEAILEDPAPGLRIGYGQIEERADSA